MEGGIVFGLTAAFYSEITLKNGHPEQNNFDTYQMMLLNQMPEITVKVIESGAALGGIGEVGVPPIAPAVVNAIFAATGRRIRALPLARQGFVV